jgi:hypothetical protein
MLVGSDWRDAVSAFVLARSSNVPLDERGSQTARGRFPSSASTTASPATTTACEPEITGKRIWPVAKRKVPMRKTPHAPIFIVLLCWFSLCFPACGEQDLTGKWVGTFHVLPQGGGPREDKAVVFLKQQGEEVTGTLGPTESNQMPFKTGKIKGNALKIEMEGNRIVFTLTLDGGNLTGEIRDADRESRILARVELKRG